MVQRDDRRGFGQAVALDDDEAEPLPELLERGGERRGADDERPELHAEHPVDAAVAPPARRNRQPRRRIRCRQDRRAPHAPCSTSRIFGTQTITEMRHSFTRRTMSWGLKLRMNTTVPSTIGGMLVAIDWPNMWLSGSRFRKRSGRNGQAYFLYLSTSLRDRDGIREDVAVADHHALGLGRRARREDDLRDVIAIDRHVGNRTVGAPVEIGHPPDLHLGTAAPQAPQRNVVARQNQPGVDDVRAPSSQIPVTSDSRSGTATAPERITPQ